MRHVCVRTEQNVRYSCGKLKVGVHLEDLGEDGRVTLQLIVKLSTEMVWSGFICLGVNTIGKVLYIYGNRSWG